MTKGEGRVFLFKSEMWAVVRRKGFAKGMWLKMQHRQSGVQLWFGSIHWILGCTQMQHAQEVLEALQKLRPTTLPVVMGADSHASVGWCWDQGTLKPYGLDGKGLRVDKLQGRAISVLPSLPQKDLRTSRPRKANVKGKVFDVIAAARVCTSDVVLVQDSYAIIGTDHEFLHARVYLQGSHRKGKRFDTGPGPVVGKPAIGYIDQSALKDMAKQFTKARPSSAYVDPEIVKKAFREARVVEGSPATTKDTWRKSTKAGHCRNGSRIIWTKFSRVAWRSCNKPQIRVGGEGGWSRRGPA